MVGVRWFACNTFHVSISACFEVGCSFKWRFEQRTFYFRSMSVKVMAKGCRNECGPQWIEISWSSFKFNTTSKLPSQVERKRLILYVTQPLENNIYLTNPRWKIAFDYSWGLSILTINNNSSYKFCHMLCLHRLWTTCIIPCGNYILALGKMKYNALNLWVAWKNSRIVK